jgi:DNA-binding NarL/FixJ family response regulator
MRNALKCMLEAIEGFRVIGEGGSAAEGWARIEALQPDVVLADFRLADRDVCWLLKALSERGLSVPTVILSIHSEEDIIISCLEAGARGYLPKTCSSAELEQALRTVASGETYLHPNLAMKTFHRARSKYSENREGVSVSPREKELLLKVVEGLSNQDIADQLHLSLSTVKAHMRGLFRKLEVEDRTKALVEAFRKGILTKEDLCRENGTTRPA